MFSLDRSVVQRHIRPGDRVIDLGCGTGRAILPLLKEGHRCVAFDLSQAMLDEVRTKATGVNALDDLTCVRGNLVDLDCFGDNQFEMALCLFSTLGMIRGHASRQTFLRQLARILKPQGRFVLQVHNYWVHLFDPEGPWWMLRNAWHTATRSEIELGDRFYPYRGIPDMYLHSFSARELKKLLRAAGFQIREWIPLAAQQDATLPLPRFLSGLRASGWIVVAEAA